MTLKVSVQHLVEQRPHWGNQDPAGVFRANPRGRHPCEDAQHLRTR